MTVARKGLMGFQIQQEHYLQVEKQFSNSDIIDYITIATTGNAADFGDLTVAKIQAVELLDQLEVYLQDLNLQM